MGRGQVIQIENQSILYDVDVISHVEPGIFEPQYLARKKQLLGAGQGRGEVNYFQIKDQEFVLRHYRRGGLIARVLADRYVWTGLSRTRAWREWLLLMYLWDKGLPVVRPYAARVQRDGMLYRADIITYRLSSTLSLAQWLSKQSLPNEYWRKVGMAIGSIHGEGVYHADLNAHNILIDPEGGVNIIDFDRGRIQPLSRHWRQSNLERLKRSLFKLKSQNSGFYFSNSNFDVLIEGYGQI